MFKIVKQSRYEVGDTVQLISIEEFNRNYKNKPNSFGSHFVYKNINKIIGRSECLDYIRKPFFNKIVKIIEVTKFMSNYEEYLLEGIKEFSPDNFFIRGKIIDMGG